MISIKEFRGLIEPYQGEEDGLFICCASYEDRCMGIINRFAENYTATHSAIFVSREYLPKGATSRNLETLGDILSDVSVGGPTIIHFEIDKPLSSMRHFEELYKTWQTSFGTTAVTIDITTFPRQELLMILRILESLPNGPTIRIFYSEPSSYSTEHPEGWLTRGVKAVRSVPGFGGIQQPSKAKLLIMYLGHEEERAAITWKRHQPQKTIAIIPDEHYRPELGGIVEETHHLLFTQLGNFQMHPSVPARGVCEARDAVINIWEEYHESHFLVVAPLGTKLQLLGIYSAAMEKQDIQITYAVPSVYNYQSYSVGTGPIWEIYLHSK